MDLITAITGHRPERLNNRDFLRDDLTQDFKDFGITKVVQGMAPGADLIAAQVACRNGIPFVAVKPYPSHRDYVVKNYPTWVGMYDMALIHAEEVVEVTPTYEGAWVFQRRNEWMVDNSDMLIAIWDGVRKGGTWNCIHYAVSKGKRIERILP